jgi:hypothetical protein
MRLSILAYVDFSNPADYYRYMHRRKLLLGALIVLLLPLSAFVPAFAQSDSGADEAGPNPFVSGLRVAVRDPEVRLTWEARPDIAGGYRVYRSTEQIDTESLSESILVAELGDETEVFVDVPPDPGSYFYAVTIVAEDGTEYRLAVPFQNRTEQAVRIERSPDPEALAATVQSIQAEVRGEEITVSFDADRADRELVLFRRAAPIANAADLTEAIRVDTVGSNRKRIEDVGVPGVSYFYALLDEVLVASGNMRLEPGRNTTTSAVQIPLAAERIARVPTDVPRSRFAPLPLLQLDTSAATGRMLEQFGIPARAAPITAQTSEALSALVVAGPSAPSPLSSVERLPTETANNRKGVEGTLAAIVEDQLLVGDYEEAERFLTNLLSLSIDPELEARVRFYRGQALYFQRQYEDAFLAFLAADRWYFEESRRWMDSILSILSAN